MLDLALIIPGFLEKSLTTLSKEGINFIAHSCEKKDCPSTPIKQTISPKEYGREWVTHACGDSKESIIPTLAVWSGIVCGRRLLPIPLTAADMGRVLDRIEGRQHQLLTIMALQFQGQIRYKTWMTRIKFKRLSLQERLQLLEAKETWQGRLGGYVGNMSFLKFITSVNGSPSFIFGIPFYEIYTLLKGTSYERK